MIGAEAVIGRTDIPSGSANPGKYRLTSEDRSGAGVNLMPDSMQTLIDATVKEVDGRTVLTFTKMLEEDGELAIPDDESSTWVYAVGSVDGDNTYPSVHAIEGSFRLLLTPCREVVGATDDGAGTETDAGSESDGQPVEILSGSTAEEDTNYKLFVAHGYMMAIAWGVLVPLAVASSLLRDALTRLGLPEGAWFSIHKACNFSAILLTVIAFALAVKAFNNESDDHFEDGHPRIGLIIFVMVFVQVLFGFVRPPKPGVKAASSMKRHSSKSTRNAQAAEMIEIGHEGGGGSTQNISTTSQEDESSQEDRDENPRKPLIRWVWELFHRALALALIALAWTNCNSGIDIMAEDYGTDKSRVFWGVTGSLAILIAILAIVTRIYNWKK